MGTELTLVVGLDKAVLVVDVALHILDDCSANSFRIYCSKCRSIVPHGCSLKPTMFPPKMAVASVDAVAQLDVAL